MTYYLSLTLTAAALVTALPLAAAAQDGMGGARSNGNVREQVAAGIVPYPEAFAIEGMLAEHHFPVRQERCDERFCVLTAMGHGLHQPTATRSGYLFIEPISGLDPARFQRAPQNLAVVIDRSGSMTGWKIAAVLEATHRLIDALDERDRLALIAFDTEVELLQPSRPVTNRQYLHALVDRIFAGGTTNIIGGMQAGFAEIAPHIGPEIGSRLVIMTDEQPNVGDTSKQGFLELTGQYARQGIGLSILGIGLDLGTDLAFSVSQLRGGSYHYLEDEHEVERLFGRDFDSFLTPVAHDLTIRIRPGVGLRVAEVFGVPREQVLLKADGSAVLRAATVFFDRKRSGLVARLEPDRDAPYAALSATAEVSWSYSLASDGSHHTGRTLASHCADDPGTVAEFESADHYRGYALVNFAELLKGALDLWHSGRQAQAVAVLHRARAALDLDAWVIRDTALATERRLADDILAAMARRPDDYCDPYYCY